MSTDTDTTTDPTLAALDEAWPGPGPGPWQDCSNAGSPRSWYILQPPASDPDLSIQVSTGRAGCPAGWSASVSVSSCLLGSHAIRHVYEGPGYPTAVEAVEAARATYGDGRWKPILAARLRAALAALEGA